MDPFSTTRKKKPLWKSAIKITRCSGMGRTPSGEGIRTWWWPTEMSRNLTQCCSFIQDIVSSLVVVFFFLFVDQINDYLTAVAFTQRELFTLCGILRWLRRNTYAFSHTSERLGCNTRHSYGYRIGSGWAGAYSLILLNTVCVYKCGEYCVHLWSGRISNKHLAIGIFGTRAKEQTETERELESVFGHGWGRLMPVMMMIWW